MSSPQQPHSPADRCTTADLVSALARGDGTVRIVCRDGSRFVPLAHQPRNDSDTEPWAEYDGDTGVVVRRHASTDVIQIPVTDTTELGDEQRVDRSVLNRLRAAGIVCTSVHDHGTYARITFQDGGYVNWSGTTRHGIDVSNQHPIADHGSLGCDYHTENASAPAEDHPDAEFATGDYDTDSAALVAHLIALADRHGRTT
ncbi:hypothetical protein ABZY19_30170 [Streptomyces sp. NPDC006475]|uniref:hypothetical protein n=1 Tax=Streptomyces sp. NPDC006475 TaxID=3155719 RepID=UPI0033A58B22